MMCRCVCVAWTSKTCRQSACLGGEDISRFNRDIVHYDVGFKQGRNGLRERVVSKVCL